LEKGDLVKTKVPGFGTGGKSKIGIVTEANTFGTNSEEIGTIEVLHIDGTTMTWYPWQLETTI